jgi:hypothetical protein
MPDQRKVLARLMKEVDAFLRAREDEQIEGITQYYQAYSDSVIPKLEKMLRRAEREGGLSWQDVKRMRLDLMAARIAEDALPELTQGVNGSLSKAMNSTFQDSYLANAWAMDQVIPNDVTIDQVLSFGGDRPGGYVIPLQQELADQFISSPWKGAMFSDRIGVINNAMARDIQTLTTEAAINGWSVDDLSTSIRDLVGVDESDRLKTRPRASRAIYRADTIARTELMRMMDAGNRSILNQNSDIMDGLVWSASPGPSARGFYTCEDCEARDGKTKEEIEDDAEDDLDINPPAHPRCRCRWLPKLKSWKSIMGRYYSKDMDKLEHVDEYEMKYYNQQSNSIASMKVQPFDEWTKEQVQ